MDRVKQPIKDGDFRRNQQVAFCPFVMGLSMKAINTIPLVAEKRMPTNTILIQ